MAMFNKKGGNLIKMVLSAFLLLLTFHFQAAEGYIPRCTAPYAYRNGDTCKSIAQTLRVTYSTFRAWNPNLDCHNMFDGQWLCSGYQTPLTPGTCQIAYGFIPAYDACETVMSKFGLSVQRFREINPGLNCNNLFDNQWVCIFMYKN